MCYCSQARLSTITALVNISQKGIICMDGIIFDVDGTLWNSTDTVAESWNKAISEHSDLDVRINAAILKNLFGKPMDEIYDAVFPQLSKEEQQKLGDLCFEYENELLETKPGILYQDVSETLRALSQKTDLYIVSNCQRGYIEVFMKTTGLGDVIKDHLCFGDTLTSKGQTILTLMARRGLKDVVYVGDTLGDYQACGEAGIPFIFAEYGFGDVPQAEVKIRGIAELLSIF